jgi:peptide/nickel transport system substrate-binding protein
MEQAGLGRVVSYPAGGTEHIQFNFSDPHTVVEGEKGSVRSRHPFLADKQVRQALRLAINQPLIVGELYGILGVPATHQISTPSPYAPTTDVPPFNLGEAARLLDEAGWRIGTDGIRTKNGVKMRMLFQTSLNSVRQLTQAIIKRDLESIGVEVELKAIVADVYFGDANNPDSWPQFLADMQMYTHGPTHDPLNYLRFGLSTEVAQRANKWSGANPTRYQNPEYDALWHAARTELDPLRRDELFRAMVQMLHDDVVVVPLVARRGAAVARNGLHGMDLTAWDSSLWNLANWYREPV